MELMTLACVAAFSPLVGAALAGFLGWKLGRTFSHTVTIASVAISLAASLLAFRQVVGGGASMDAELYTWAAGEGFWRNLPLAGLIGVAMAVEMVLALWMKVDMAAMPVRGTMPPGSNTKALGAVLYTDYLLPFELAAVILLVAIVAAIAITLRRRKETKYQDPRDQLAARPADRLKIVKGVK